MSKRKQVTLSITVTDSENQNTSTSVVQTDSLMELKRLLDLAGVVQEAGVTEDTYTAAASNEVRMPNQRINNPRFGDNSLAEDDDLDLGLDDFDTISEFDAIDPNIIADTYNNLIQIVDTEEALARVADEFGITGEEVKKIIEFVRDNAKAEVGESQIIRSIRDYLPEEFDSRSVRVKPKLYNVSVEYLDQNFDSHIKFVRVEAEGEAEARNTAIEHAKDDAAKRGRKFTLVDADALVEENIAEAFGLRKSKWEEEQLRRQYEAVVALLPIEKMMVTVDQLGDNEYFGGDLMSGDSNIVCFAIETNAKPRLTFASTYGDVHMFKPGMKVLTYHDQTGAERPATVITAFTGKEWSTPEGREAIKSRMAKGGMDPKRKYSVRVFK